MLLWKYRVLVLSKITARQYTRSLNLDFFREDQWLSIFSKMSKVQGNVEVIVVSMWWCRMTSACTNTCLAVFIKHCNMKVRLKPVLSFPLSSYTSKCNTYTSLCHNITMQGFSLITISQNLENALIKMYTLFVCSSCGIFILI